MTMSSLQLHEEIAVTLKLIERSTKSLTFLHPVPIYINANVTGLGIKLTST